MIYDWPSFLLTCSSFQMQCSFLTTFQHTEVRDLLLSWGLLFSYLLRCPLLLRIQIAANKPDPNLPPSQDQVVCCNFLAFVLFINHILKVTSIQTASLLTCSPLIALAWPMFPVEGLSWVEITIFWTVSLVILEVLRNQADWPNLLNVLGRFI